MNIAILLLTKFHSESTGVESLQPPVPWLLLADVCGAPARTVPCGVRNALCPAPAATGRPLRALPPLLSPSCSHMHNTEPPQTACLHAVTRTHGSSGSFHGLTALSFSPRSRAPLHECRAVCLSTHWLKAASKSGQLSTKLLLTSVCKFCCVDASFQLIWVNNCAMSPGQHAQPTLGFVRTCQTLPKWPPQPGVLPAGHESSVVPQLPQHWVLSVRRSGPLW